MAAFMFDVCGCILLNTIVSRSVQLPNKISTQYKPAAGAENVAAVDPFCHVYPVAPTVVAFKTTGCAPKQTPLSLPSGAAVAETINESRVMQPLKLISTQ